LRDEIINSREINQRGCLHFLKIDTDYQYVTGAFGNY
jgi:hypothetical protein